VTTNSNHSLAVADNLLNQDFEVYSPNETWVTDLTYSVPVVQIGP
jgi:transposase InsO family protein